MRIIAVRGLDRASWKSIFRDCDVLLILGDVGSARVLEEAAALCKVVVGVAGRSDDHHIARVIDSIGYLVEGHLAYIDGLYFGGIGGREPVANIYSLLRELGEVKPRSFILATYYPPYMVMDYSTLPGARRGLLELHKLYQYKPLAVVIGECMCPGTFYIDGILHVCPGSLATRPSCYSVIEASSGIVTARVACEV
ncbi:metallophosphoesterase family protein [Hyperthermus butylicus]|uniref:Uncharacterized protein n=1 Tax=Hyperthermus butylicus (strain DSM 5456 / JCM 9403 / PLM1-5) TaxID=415426 RepID=A2BLG7_HYPBU|nr:hypothetical protein [Hyperthermus butylicus]ABM80828.1 hypothetical protein Hbut_0980 [Hyperthermus butylicus DSM 5456]